MSFIFPYWQKYRKSILVAIAFLSFEAFFDVLQPTIVAQIINLGVQNSDMDVVLRLGGLMLLVTVLLAACAVVRCVISSRVSQSFGADLRLGLFAKINSFSFETLGKKETAGLITRLTNDTSHLVLFTNGMMRIFVKSPLVLIGAFIMTLLLNFRLAIILVAVTPIIGVLMYISMKVGFPLFNRMQQALDKNNSVIREYLSGVRVVKAYNTFQQETERFDESNANLAESSTIAMRTTGVFQPIISFTINMGLVAALWLARDWVAEQQMNVGQIIAFINYMNQIMFSMGTIFMVYQQLIRAKASAERIGEILSEETTEISSQNNVDNLVPPSVEFSNVTFLYNQTASKPVLQDVSFVLPAGKTLGIIGSTGSGKTSLVQLIPGFYLPNSGVVKINDTPVSQENAAEIRNLIAYVAQQNTLFYGTIADNIKMGKFNATDQEVEQAAKSACAHDFIMEIPDGYNAIIGQKGVNLSGGQRQRIGIARALLKKSSILILDDCVSAVDVETEAQIMHAVNSINPAPTCFMITQRISSVMNLPHILVLDEGKAVGFGNHSTLINSCETYQEIYHSQLI
ncbi:MAG: ABC transporter ATP-binding protein/permease [Firmicutes bacterium]|nr:ABC transporter ATP-binding protein/permease [Bacillota bacterium]